MLPPLRPQTPAPIYLLSLDEELTSRLHELIRDVANYIEPQRMFSRGRTELASWIRFNVAAVYELDFAEEICFEMGIGPGGLNVSSRRPPHRMI